MTKKFEIKLGFVDFIRVSVTGGGGSLVSSLRENGVRQYRAAIDGMESLVLAHACAGINIEDPNYVKGIEIALEAIVNAY